jgi:hypothetical protein
MAETAKRMGRPPGEPSKVVRLPLPVAALAKRLAEKSLRAGGYQRLPRCRGQAGHCGATDGDLGRLRVSFAGG